MIKLSLAQVFCIRRGRLLTTAKSVDNNPALSRRSFLPVHPSVLLRSGVDSIQSGTIIVANGPVIPLADTTGIEIGMGVERLGSGPPNIQTNRTVISIIPNVSITLSGGAFSGLDGSITLRIGGCDLDVISTGLSLTTARQLFSISTQGETTLDDFSNPISVQRYGGDADASGVCSALEQDLHDSGLLFLKKIKK